MVKKSKKKTANPNKVKENVAPPIETAKPVVTIINEGIRPKEEILERIREWEGKKALIEDRKSLEYGIADNAIAKLKDVINNKLTVEDVERHMKKQKEYEVQCLESHKIRQRQITKAKQLNSQLEKTKRRDRWIVPTTENDLRLEKLPRTLIAELGWVIS